MSRWWISYEEQTSYSPAPGAGSTALGALAFPGHAGSIYLRTRVVLIIFRFERDRTRSKGLEQSSQRSPGSSGVNNVVGVRRAKPKAEKFDFQTPIEVTHTSALYSLCLMRSRNCHRQRQVLSKSLDFVASVTSHICAFYT